MTGLVRHRLEIPRVSNPRVDVGWVSETMVSTHSVSALLHPKKVCRNIFAAAVAAAAAAAAVAVELVEARFDEEG